MEKVEKGQNQDLNSCPLEESTDALPAELHVLIETIITRIYYISKSSIPWKKKKKSALIFKRTNEEGTRQRLLPWTLVLLPADFYPQEVSQAASKMVLRP